MHKVLHETRNDKEKNNQLVNIFTSGLEDLDKKFKKCLKKK